MAGGDARLVDMVAGTVTSAALPGALAWDVVVGHRFIVAVAAPAPDSCTSALAEAAADDAVTVESLVGTIPLGGPDQVDSFAIVWWPGPGTDDVTAVVRGVAVVDLASPGGTRRFDSRGIRPWHLADFGAVIAVRVTGADAPLDRLGEAADVVGPARAAFRASVVEWSAVPRPPRRTDAAITDADTVLVPRRHGPDTGVDRGLADADTIRRPPASPSPVVTGAPVDDGAPPTTPIRAFVEILGAPERPEASMVPEPPAPESSTAPDIADVPAFRIGAGEAHLVTGPVLIGRRPLAPRIPDPAGTAPELIAVTSPNSVVSGTHLELRREGTRLVATDLRSTNGTIVRGPSGTRRMRAGESIVVAPGTRLDLGDGTIVEILTPRAPHERSRTDSRHVP